MDARARGEAAPGIDYFTWWTSARAVSTRHVADIYSPEGRSKVAAALAGLAASAPRTRGGEAARLLLESYRGGFEDHATPFLHALFGLSGTLSYELDHERFTAASLVALGSALLVLGRLAGWSWATALSATGVLLLFFDPIRSDLRTSNINGLQLGMLAGVLVLLRGAHRAPIAMTAGALLALGAAAKPNTLLVPVLLVLDRLLGGRRREAGFLSAGVLAGGVVAGAVGAAYMRSPEAWVRWARSVGGAFLVSPWGSESGNYGLVQVLRETTGLRLSLPALLVVLAAIISGIRGGGGPGRPPRGSVEEFQRSLVVAGAGCAVPLLTAGYVWLHYFVLALPLAFAALAVSRTPREKAVSSVAFACFLVPGLLRDHLPSGLVAEAALLNAAVATMLLVGLGRLRTGALQTAPLQGDPPLRGQGS